MWFRKKAPLVDPYPELDLSDDDAPKSRAQISLEEEAEIDARFVPDPMVARYMAANPYTRISVIGLGLLLDEARIEAANSLREELIITGQRMAPHDKQFMLERRIERLFKMYAQAEDTGDIQGEILANKMYGITTTNSQLESIQESIDRSAVAANALDFVKEHPVATALGVLAVKSIFK